MPPVRNTKITDFAGVTWLCAAWLRNADRSDMPKPSNPIEPACGAARLESAGWEGVTSRFVMSDSKFNSELDHEFIANGIKHQC